MTFVESDALALAALRRGSACALARPAELTRSLRQHYAGARGYQFTWGQLIELPPWLPDPDTGRYSGLGWAVVPTAVWSALHPRLRAAGWHLHHLLRWADESEHCLSAVPEYLYVIAGSPVELARLVALNAADAAKARAWLVEQFLPRDLPGVLDAYHGSLVDSLECIRERRLATKGDWA